MPDLRLPTAIGHLGDLLHPGGHRFPWPEVLTESGVSARGLARGPRTVTLRPIRVGDESAWRRLRLADDARLTPWEATLPPDSPDALGSFRDYVRAQNRLARRGEAMPFVLEVDGVFAGQVSVSSIRWGALECASVGYWIGAPWEGRGVMTLAVAMVLDHLLGARVGLHRVEIDVRPSNARSLAVCRRLGLHSEGVRRGLMHINGQWADHVTFAVVAEDAPAGGFVGRLRQV
ncbi:MAG: GNAT family N-acetyltransferase [Actinomyces succiniciruminis]|uniref:Acetyltransferase, GNAT n=1 Tax=Actinomyces succiniciruminis TaxID=1522002 RepID=A0A1L7RQX5_9ACTO|nr:GNAT family protein [Actinomyces succiniciruminis]MBE6476442.1 GNAT family N-acetyltransferase [Actinomyces succiniciruminis]MBM6979671.1 GNAT family N-acetyltransferase [Actinomyces succiniciruminis]CED91784.1 Acetyltransferase, GNAT [Actinomyces succiniciruminis]